MDMEWMVLFVWYTPFGRDRRQCQSAEFCRVCDSAAIWHIHDGTISIYNQSLGVSQDKFQMYFID